MKRYIPWMTILMVAIVSVGLVSCGDDEDSPKNSMIVGTWTEPYNDKTTTLTLTSSGKFDFYVYGSALTGKGDYTYDEVSRTLSLFYNPKNSWGDKVYIVQTLTEKHLVIVDYNGNTHSFTKR